VCVSVSVRVCGRKRVRTREWEGVQEEFKREVSEFEISSPIDSSRESSKEFTSSRERERERESVCE
jgi:hypothetical protein